MLGNLFSAKYRINKFSSDQNSIYIMRALLCNVVALCSKFAKICYFKSFCCLQHAKSNPRCELLGAQVRNVGISFSEISFCGLQS